MASALIDRLENALDELIAQDSPTLADQVLLDDVEDKLLDATDAARRMVVARALPYHPDLEAALIETRCNHDHARVILACLRRTPADLREVVEKELIKAAETVDPVTLATFCRELVSRLGGDEDSEEAAQRRFSRRWARLTDTFDGMVRLDGMLDPVGAATIRAAIAPLPEQAGEKPQLIVTMNYPDFIAGQEAKLLASATLNGIRISGSTARMLACDAGIIPIVLGSNGEVLDLGRKTALWTAAQRRALRAEHDGCGFPGCQVPGRRCQAHHVKFRSHGGPTAVANGVLLCRFHHWLIHHSNWTIAKDHNAKITVWRT